MSQKNTINDWAKENRAGFYNWIYNTFYEEINKSPKESKNKENVNKSRKACDCSSNNESEEGECSTPVNGNNAILPHQRFIRDYVQYDSPYRGILLYHGLGTGKSFSSIAAAEGFLSRHQKIVVLIPASLLTNYRQEITRFGSIR
jgi:hypothetical protein